MHCNVLAGELPGRCGSGVQVPASPPTSLRCPAQGSLASGTFAAYNPVTQEMELCDVEVPEGMEEEEELVVVEVA